MNVPANVTQLELKAIVYATDFSSYSQNAGNYASLLARQFNADLLAAHAFVLTNPAMEAEAEARPPVKSMQRKELEDALAAVARRHGEGLRRAVPVLIEGDPRELIPRLAKENTPSLVVLGTHGRGRIERGIVGSVAERILRATSSPSLTVGPAVPACDPAHATFRRILYATGLSAADVHGAPYALAMAQAFDASLDVLHVVNPDDVKHPDRFSEIQRQFHALLEKLVP
jgi:nucleotide-binding universal stress UspA family protein